MVLVMRRYVLFSSTFDVIAFGSCYYHPPWPDQRADLLSPLITLRNRKRPRSPNTKRPSRRLSTRTRNPSLSQRKRRPPSPNLLNLSRPKRRRPSPSQPRPKRRRLSQPKKTRRLSLRSPRRQRARRRPIRPNRPRRLRKRRRSMRLPLLLQRYSTQDHPGKKCKESGSSGRVYDTCGSSSPLVIRYRSIPRLIVRSRIQPSRSHLQELASPLASWSERSPSPRLHPRPRPRPRRRSPRRRRRLVVSFHPRTSMLTDVLCRQIQRNLLRQQLQAAPLRPQLRQK